MFTYLFWDIQWRILKENLQDVKTCNNKRKLPFLENELTNCSNPSSCDNFSAIGFEFGLLGFLFSRDLSPSTPTSQTKLRKLTDLTQWQSTISWKSSLASHIFRTKSNPLCLRSHCKLCLQITEKRKACN